MYTFVCQCDAQNDLFLMINDASEWFNILNCFFLPACNVSSKVFTIMSWIRNNSFGSGYGKLQNYSQNSGEYDPSACFDSFRKHWQQISDIVELTKVHILFNFKFNYKK